MKPEHTVKLSTTAEDAGFIPTFLRSRKIGVTAWQGSISNVIKQEPLERHKNLFLWCKILTAPYSLRLKTSQQRLPDYSTSRKAPSLQQVNRSASSNPSFPEAVQLTLPPTVLVHGHFSPFSINFVD